MSPIDHRPFNIPSVHLSFQRARIGLTKLLPSWLTPAPKNKIYLLPAPELPKKFQFSSAGITAQGQRFLIPNAKKTIFFSLGHANNSNMYAFFGKILNKLGYNLVTLELPRPENGKTYKSNMDIMTGYELVVSKGLLDLNSPLFKGLSLNRPIILLTHSSSGLAFERIVKKVTPKAQFALNHYDLVIHGGTIFDTADAAKRFNKILGHRMVSLLARAFPKSAIGTLKFEKKYLAFKAWWSGNELIEAREDGPTWEETKALKRAGTDHVDQVEVDIKSGKIDSNSNFMKIPRLFLTGNNDKAADKNTIELYANMIKQKCLPYEGKHCFLTEATKPLYWIIGILKDPKMSITNDNVIKLPQHPLVTTPRTLPVSAGTQHAAHLQM